MESWGGIAVAALWVLRELVAQVSKNRRSRVHSQIDERALLSTDERTFRRELLGELAIVRKELAVCQAQHTEGMIERDKLRQRIEQLEPDAV